MGTAGPWLVWGQEQLEEVSQEHRGQGAACEANRQVPVPPPMSTLEREATKPYLASMGAVKKWLHGGTSALGNQGHPSSGATAEGTAETGAARRLWQSLQRGTVESFGGVCPQH